MTANLLRFEYGQMNNLLNILPPRSGWKMLSTLITHRIAKGDETFIKKNISFSDFMDIDKVFCPVCLSDFQWFLIVYDKSSRTSTVYNTLDSLSADQTTAIDILTSNLCSFFRIDKDGWTINNSNEIEKTTSFTGSGYWIANTIWQLFHDQPTKLDVRDIIHDLTKSDNKIKKHKNKLKKKLLIEIKDLT